MSSINKTLKQFFREIADSIRLKLGISNKISPNDIPNLISTISTTAFYQLVQGNLMYIPESLASQITEIKYGQQYGVNSPFQNGAFREINLPNCTEIPTGCFTYCSNLKNVNLPMCNRILSNTFACCSSLNTISLSSCNFIFDFAFKDCINLKSIYLLGSSICSISSQAFPSSIKSTVKCYVPMSLLNSYQQKYNNFFDNIIGQEE